MNPFSLPTETKCHVCKSGILYEKFILIPREISGPTVLGRIRHIQYGINDVESLEHYCGSCGIKFESSVIGIPTLLIKENEERIVDGLVCIKIIAQKDYLVNADGEETTFPKGSIVYLVDSRIAYDPGGPFYERLS